MLLHSGGYLDVVMVSHYSQVTDCLAWEVSVDSRVVVVSGPSKGAVVRVKGDQLSVGRDPANHLCLRDRAVSRRHFTISKTDVAFHLVDLDSHNGTFVNGIPVRRKLLAHGDTIRVGRCELVFLITEDEEPIPQDVQFKDEPQELLSTTNVRAYRSSPSSGTDIGRMARDLNALFKIANTINSIRELEPLQQRLLQLIGEVVPADSAAIVILRHADEEPTSSCVWHRHSGKGFPDPNPARGGAAGLVGAQCTPHHALG